MSLSHSDERTTVATEAGVAENRRRLIKAAATVAPVILTLRSGATQAVVSACTANPVRTVPSATDKTYCSKLNDSGDCEETTPLGGEVITNYDEVCGDPRYVTDANNSTITYCPNNTAIYSADAVASLRCYSEGWNPN